MAKNNCYDCKWCKEKQPPVPPNKVEIDYLCEKGKKPGEGVDCKEFEPKPKTP